MRVTRVVSFKNTIVVMTSNIGSQVIQEITREGGSEEQVREAVMDVVRARYYVTEQGYAVMTEIMNPEKRAELIIEKCAHPQFRPLLFEIVSHGLDGPIAQRRHPFLVSLAAA